jgi:hypothetical protein
MQSRNQPAVVNRSGDARVTERGSVGSVASGATGAGRGFLELATAEPSTKIDDASASDVTSRGIGDLICRRAPVAAKEIGPC